MTRRAALVVVLLFVAGLAAFVALRLRSPRPGPARLADLTRERDALESRWRSALNASGERSLDRAPAADLMIGLPGSLTRSIVGQVVTGVFGETTLTLTNLHVRKAGEIRTRMVLAKRTLGEYVLEVDIHGVRGVLEAGAPVIAFGDDKVDVTLPVRIAGGGGDADVRFQWDGKGVASALCGDIDVKRSLTAGVVPRDYEVAGSFAIAVEGESIILRPSFPDLAARIAVEPTPESWKAVEAVIRERSRGCEIALDAIDVKERLGELLGRGFNVRIPQRIFKAIPLPAGVRRSVRVQGVDLAMRVSPTAVLVADDRLWYGADVAVARGNLHP